MVLLRLLRIFLLLRRSLASVSTEKIAGSIVSLVVAAVFVSAFFMWRVEYNAPRRNHHYLPLCVVVGHRHHHDGGLRRLHTGHAGGSGHRHGRHDRGRRTDRQISATVAAWFVRRHEPVTETADLASVDTERAAATTADTQAALLDRLDELAAKQDEIRAMLIELQRPPTSS
jgi:hypothetical protein